MQTHKVRCRLCLVQDAAPVLEVGQTFIKYLVRFVWLGFWCVCFTFCLFIFIFVFETEYHTVQIDLKLAIHPGRS